MIYSFKKSLLFPGVAEASGISTRNFQFVRFYPRYFIYLLDDHLRNTVTRLYDLFLLRKVDQNDLNFSPLISIDSAGGVETGNSLFNC